MAAAAQQGASENGKPAIAGQHPDNDHPVTTVAPADNASGGPLTPARTDHTQPQSGFTIGAGDLLDISVYGVPELSQKVRVTPEGNVYLALVGNVHVDGRTVEDAQALIEKDLADGGFVRSPHVTVFISEYVSQGVSVMGEVARPGIYPIYGTRRLFDVIAGAGGLTNRAGRVITITHRDAAQSTVKVALSDDLANSTESNVVILPGDTVVVSKAGVVYVVGDVQHPAGFVMENGENLTVLQALALAGGQTHTSALDGAKLIRKTPKGRQEIPVPLKKILAAKSNDVPMQADDILFVPGSAAKGAAHRTLDAIVSLATGVAIRY